MKSLGMDIHQAQTVFHCLDATGRVLERGRCATTAPALTAVIARLRADGSAVRVAIEASTPAAWVHDVLVAAGAQVEVTNPYKIRLIAESRQKTDAHDAQILAELLRVGGLPTPVYVPPPAIRELREQLAMRRQLIKIRTQVVCAAKAALRRRGVPYPSRTFHTAASWTAFPAQAAVLATYHAVWQQVEQARTALEATLQAAWGTEPTVVRLQTIPGVGPTVACTAVAALGDVRRFRTSAQVAAYAGLVPRERSSGTTVVRGGITHQGRSELAQVMVQAAWAVLRTKRDAALPLKRRFYRILPQRGSQVAIVALARHLLTVLYQVWKGQTTYDDTRVGQIVHRPCSPRCSMASVLDRVNVAHGTARQ